jgi:hypothetical protein
MAEPVDPRVKLGKVGFTGEFEAPLLSIALDPTSCLGGMLSTMVVIIA